MKENFSFSIEKIVDLTHDYSSETLYWPTEEGFSLENKFEGMTEKGYFYSAKKFSAPEHGGTHLDAPIHFAKNGKTVDQIPLSRLIGDGIIIDVSSKITPDYQIQIKDLENWEKEHSRIQENSIVLIKTGYGNLWPNREKYLGTAKLGTEALDELHFPGIHPEAANWLVNNRKIKAIGIDTQSIDYGKSKFFETHRILCESEIPFFENVAHLDQLPEIGSVIVGLPMKIKNGSGAPLRLIAFLP